MRFARISCLTVLFVVAGLPATGAHEPPAPSPTVVESAEATPVEGGLDVSAVVDFGGTAPVVLGTDPTGDAPPANNAGADYGLDVTELSVWIPDGDEPLASFGLHLATFDQPPPPEIVRYYLTFQLGGQPFALQAKTSDFVSGANLANDPQTVAQRLASYGEHVASTGTLPQFRLRGNCETVQIVNNCGHVAWISGAFDTDGNEIRIDLPLDLDAMPALRPGAALTADQGAWASLQAALDAAPTRDTMAAGDQLGLPYVIPTRAATATLVDVTGTPVGGPVELSVGDDGSVQGHVATAGLEPGDYELVVEACIAENCGTATLAVVV